MELHSDKCVRCGNSQKLYIVNCFHCYCLKCLEASKGISEEIDLSGKHCAVCNRVVEIDDYNLPNNVLGELKEFSLEFVAQSKNKLIDMVQEASTRSDLATQYIKQVQEEIEKAIKNRDDIAENQIPAKTKDRIRTLYEKLKTEYINKHEALVDDFTEFFKIAEEACGGYEDDSKLNEYFSKELVHWTEEYNRFINDPNPNWEIVRLQNQMMNTYITKRAECYNNMQKTLDKLKLLHQEDIDMWNKRLVEYTNLKRNLQKFIHNNKQNIILMTEYLKEKNFVNEK